MRRTLLARRNNLGILLAAMWLWSCGTPNGGEGNAGGNAGAGGEAIGGAAGMGGEGGVGGAAGMGGEGGVGGSVAQGTTVKVVVRDTTTNLPLAGVFVTAGTVKEPTNTDGAALLDIEPGKVVVQIEAKGYVGAAFPITIDKDAPVEKDVYLLAMGPPIPIDTEKGGTYTYKGVEVDLPPNAIVDESGVAVTGPAEITIAPIDPTTDALRASPGPLDGVDEPGTDPVPLISVFMADISLWRGEEKLKLAPDKLATLRFPIPAAQGTVYAPGDEIPAWWFDMKAGVWQREGTGKVATNTEMPGALLWTVDVAHFTWWNCDTPCPASCDTDKLGKCGIGVGQCSSVTNSWFCVQTIFPSSEVCNGLDDNCDGQVDEGVASPEVCDNIDNNCNGLIDDGNPGGGGECYSPSACYGDGTWACSAGNLVCTPIQLPSPEVCNGLDDNCNGQVDEGNPGVGQFCWTGNPGVCGAGTVTGCVAGSPVCSQNQQPTPEVCDNLDNNCNGQVDDGNPGGGAACTTNLPGACAAGTKTCIAGQVLCKPNQNNPETCNGLDDNCNGLVDEGNPGGNLACTTNLPGVCAPGKTLCASGTINCIGNVQASAEQCNGLDDNCNGPVDEGNPGVGQFCWTGQSGVCAQGITTACTAGSLVCTQNQQPSPEICDGLDNDCNGQLENGNPGGGAACSTGLPGVCEPGTNTCVAGGYQCLSNVPASGEICNGLDDDCEGQIDNDLTDIGGPCLTAIPGICRDGIMTACNGGVPECTQNLMPDVEVCDGLDNDCDGLTDESDPNIGLDCSAGQPGVCDAGKLVCNGGILECAALNMPTVELCNGLDDDCEGIPDNGDPGGGLPCPDSGQFGICKPGTTTCSGGTILCMPNNTPTVETCNNIDEDCNGIVDDGFVEFNSTCTTSKPGVCVDGTFSACVAGTLVCTEITAASIELCDGLDNDCDGQTDESDPSMGTDCSTGQAGVCDAGKLVCNGGALQCEALKTPVTELCNNLDDDCDGTIDNGNPEGGNTCLTGIPGICAAGVEICDGGFIVCLQDLMPAAELCNGEDEDCDGVADNGDPDSGASCSTGLLGICDAGTMHCIGGGLTCTQNETATVNEICATTNRDDDCDGEFYDSDSNCCVQDSDCPNNSCVNNECAPVCWDGFKNGQESDIDCGGPDCLQCGVGDDCIVGTDCTTGQCVNNICVGVTCPDGIQNQDESDVDCGGQSCPGCQSGQSCNGPADCASGICSGGICN